MPQLTGMSCWAAAAAMVVGWRDRVPVQPEELASGAGRWEAYRSGLQPSDVEGLAGAFGLTVEASQVMTAERMRQLLVDMGPLWLGEASPGLHSIVVTGMFGDGFPGGSFVRINDPWPVGRGERYVLPFGELAKNFQAATDAVGVHAQVLHAGGRGRGARGMTQTSRSTTRARWHGDDATSPRPLIGQASPHEKIMQAHPHARSSQPVARAFDVVPAGERYVQSSTLAVDPLTGHGGSGDNLFLRWNEMARDTTMVDVVVHLHGYTGDAPTRAMLERKVALSGLDLGARPRPTLGIVPRGRKVSQRELDADPRANPRRYTFDRLARNGGMATLVDQALAWLGAQILWGSAPQLHRLILTAHSGGGAALSRIVRHWADWPASDPHEVHLFDALYSDVQADGVAAWARHRIDIDGHSGTLPAGALRAIYVTSGTTRHHEHLERAVAIPPALATCYRVDDMRHRDAHGRPAPRGSDHDPCAATYGPTLLADVTASLSPMGTQGLSVGYGTPVGMFGYYRQAAARPFAEADADERSEREIDELGAETGESAASAASLAITARGLAAFANDAVSVDHRHLRAFPGMSHPFALTGDALRALCRANRFVLPESGRVAFGLRGCTILDPNDGSFRPDIALDTDIPDHLHSRCVVGVWNLDSNEIAVFRGSTVPNENQMGRQVGNRGSVCNMLLTGRHLHRVGTHRGRVRGVLREAERRIVLRSRNDLLYATDDDFDSAMPGDNIHPSFTPASQRFSSAGCLTVRGNATNHDARVPDRHTDPPDEPGWATFRERLGLTRDHAPTAEDGREFVVVLLTGREAQRACHQGTSDLARLRFGSQGPDVEALQRHLTTSGHYTGSIDGDMGPTTTMAWIHFQQARDGGHADGIVTPSDALAMGFSL